MKPFRYDRAQDMSGAVAMLAAAPRGALLGGGTNLVGLMKLEVATPDVLVDVRHVISDRVEELPVGGLRIGGAIPNSDLAARPPTRVRYPVLSEALLSGASGQLRHLATVAGNLLQRTRCVHLQDITTPRNKREPWSACSAEEGFHRQAVIGWSEH